MATDLALRYPDRVRALVLLEGDASREQAQAVAAWVDQLTDRLRMVAAQDGVGAVAQALVTEVAGESVWRAFPDEIRRLLQSNGPAILAETPTRRLSSASRSKRSPQHSPTREKRLSAADT